MMLDTTDDLLWQQLKTLPAFRALLRAVEARFYSYVDLPEPLLDIGCGDGNFAQLALPGRRITAGIDPWWRPLNKAVKAGNYELPLQALGDNMPFADNYFAAAFSNSVLEHIPDIQPVLNEISRVLRPGGRFLITTPSHYFTEFLGGAALFERLHLDGMAERYRRWFNFISRHAHTDPPQTWADRLATAGFVIERWQYYFSRDALRTLELGHAQGLPSAALHALTGHWIVAPWESSLGPTERWVRPYYEEEASTAEGAYLLFIVRKESSQAVDTYLPPPMPIAVQ
ncbi:MAG: class I SAM-dependent methyltransferase [Anaerolineales bacterium]|uniref:class I SAM-dependent methyltransferase n=1 Tax=Promineifilum sp. TaxID=2664178 RepID=UPI001DC709BB|nr:class I SAM-dependent methyltransferase [Anaerolineales bacterium]MCB8936239.1 class I SAM-dependent methyltransferase [Promineifilum sp.]MCO5181823.1 class I SAM-dependent methyltransferase [Promineifilum sp.]